MVPLGKLCRAGRTGSLLRSPKRGRCRRPLFIFIQIADVKLMTFISDPSDSRQLLRVGYSNCPRLQVQWLHVGREDLVSLQV